MNDIICPHCKKAFKVDKQGYADILKQVYDKEFDNKLNERLLQLEKDKSMEINLEKKEAERLLQEYHSHTLLLNQCLLYCVFAF